MAGDVRQPVELAWFQDTNSQLEALTHRPAECSAVGDDPKHSLGRLAFNSPRLLGGQAGRMGLSCASCHPSGRASAEFFIQQISDQAGNADISHHFLSSQGGDNQFNPKKIPDLADRENLKISNRFSPEFDDLLTQLIEVEFDGQKPTPLIFDSLKHYLDSLDLSHCDSVNPSLPRNLASDWSLINDALSAMHYASKLNDMDTLKFINTALRAALETFYRFYGVAASSELDRSIIELSRSIQSMNLRSDDKERAADISALSAKLTRLQAQLSVFEHHSLYNSKIAIRFLSDRD